MGQQPAKFFPMPTPYGQSPDMGVLAQAKAAQPAPLNNFLPLNPPDPSQAQPPAQAAMNQGGGLASGFSNPNIYGYGGGAQKFNKFYDY